jgi:hypothetical protein
MVGEDFCRCAFCDKVFSIDRIGPCHIFHAGSSLELFYSVSNILPGDFKCHGRFDAKTTEGRERQIEAILPGRWEKLLGLKRERAGVLAR